MAAKSDKIRLSPSALNIFLECPRCFWLQYRADVHRPRGPFPSLPGGMDIVIKKYFDSYRAVGKMPPEIEGKIPGQLFADVEILNKWRNWRSGLSYKDPETDAVLVGALDDCIAHDGYFIPADYKTRGFDVKEGGEAFYQNQLNCYSFLLSENDLKEPGFAYLIYFIPKDIKPVGQVQFMIDVKKVATNTEQARKTFEAAVKVLQGSAPAAHSNCEFCAWALALSEPAIGDVG